MTRGEAGGRNNAPIESAPAPTEPTRPTPQADIREPQPENPTPAPPARLTDFLGKRASTTPEPTRIWHEGTGYDENAAAPLLDDGVRGDAIGLSKMADGKSKVIRGKSGTWNITKSTDEQGRAVITHFSPAGEGWWGFLLLAPQIRTGNAAGGHRRYQKGRE